MIMNVFATIQFMSISTQLWGLYDTEVKPLFGIIALIVFVVGAMFNISKVLGEERDYKGFFMGVGRFMLAMVVIIAVAEAIKAMTLS